MSEVPEYSAADTARGEAARLAGTLAAGIVSVLLMVAAERAAASPDFWRTARMRAARDGERILAALAGTAWRAAERARLAYERERA
jgi:hypothetical protein